jgi:hypothetical protein
VKRPLEDRLPAIYKIGAYRAPIPEFVSVPDQDKRQRAPLLPFCS